jgi:SAM-dependent methyltransferase
LKHPAKFTPSILAAIEPLLPVEGVILDPFAGTGRVHEFGSSTLLTLGVELEPEWAEMHPRTQVGNALNLPFLDGCVDAIVTSPTYGNRMADHHEAKDASRRMTYRHTLGRPLSDDNSGAMQWGPEYRQFHVWAWNEACRVLKPGGLFILNCKDHVRGGKVQHVTRFHWQVLRRGFDTGLRTKAVRKVVTPGMRFGQNGSVRVGHEWVIAMRKDG